MFERTRAHFPAERSNVATAVPGALEVATRRVLAAQLVFIAGPDGLRDQVREFTAGTIGGDEAGAVVADLDRIAGMLIPG